jgi:hypothetical protein
VSKAKKKTIAEVFDDGKAMDAAARRAVRQAIAENARLRKPSPRVKRGRKAA